MGTGYSQKKRAGTDIILQHIFHCLLVKTNKNGYPKSSHFILTFKPVEFQQQPNPYCEPSRLNKNARFQ